MTFQPPTSPSTTAERLSTIHERIEAALARRHRAPGSVQLVAVAKTATAETLQEAWEAGQRLFGHNRVEMLEQHRQCLPQATWHLLGPLQGKKVRRAVELADVFEAVGEAKVLARLVRRLQEEGRERPLPVYAQVNLAPADGRYGCALADLGDLLEAIHQAPGVLAQGLMTVAPLGVEGEALRELFASLRQRFEQALSEGELAPGAQLSMGMSGDYETAVEEGATLVRVGRAIFPVAAT